MSEEEKSALWAEIVKEVGSIVDSAYGTDERHNFLAKAVADKIVYGTPVPWSLPKFFGRHNREST